MVAPLSDSKVLTMMCWCRAGRAVLSCCAHGARSAIPCVIAVDQSLPRGTAALYRPPHSEDHH